MDTLQNMRMFMRVVETGSFTAAAQLIGATTAQASRAVSDLESHLHTRLLNRTTRRIAMTDAGERYMQRCEQILAYVDEAEAEAGDAQATPSGKLRVHAMTSFGQHYVVPLVSRYCQRYRDVHVDLTLTQRVPDLLDEGYDVALIQAAELPDSKLVSQRLGSANSIVCTSPGYIERYGQPRVLADLQRHICLSLVSPAGSASAWRFKGPYGEEVVELGAARFTVNVAEAMAVALREGMGIGVLPTSSALPYLRAGTLVRLFPDYTLHELQIYALYLSRRYLDAKIRTWVEFLRDELPDTLAIDGNSLERSVVLTQRVA
ncbi:LysR family transcriptional regulator [Paraburkholderia sediminicola]|uniref:LysR family transcriptional regulator n=1 Tax=Paraburkholderia sediminicola TaxID=458836 RepID=UPI0038BBF8F0